MAAPTLTPTPSPARQAQALSEFNRQRAAAGEPKREPRAESRQEYLPIEKVAKRLSVTRNTLWRWRCEGRGPKWVVIGRSVRYPLVDLEEYVRLGESSR